jgi:lipopolysaccharide biosynthesis protein
VGGFLKRYPEFSVDAVYFIWKMSLLDRRTDALVLSRDARYVKHDFNARLIAFYLPQYHPIPENDAWWGKGFTEWTNVGKAPRRFPGHYQPHVPADLGYYDLRVPETRAAQAELAKTYGIEAFCYYHYWFAGRRLLERPFQEVLASKEPDFPFLLCWANQTWTGVWHGASDRILIEQTYPGVDDHRRHFESLLPAFNDPRYLRVDGKPIFVVYRPAELPDPVETIGFWRAMARDAGLNGLHFVAVGDTDWALEHGFDGAILNQLGIPPKRDQRLEFKFLLLLQRLGFPSILRYRHTIRGYFDGLPGRLNERIYPNVIPNWDNTPRSGSRGFVMHGSTPELFREQLARALVLTRGVRPENRLVFIKSWNEWAEGNHLEPDLKFGLRYLEVVRECLNDEAMEGRPA